MTLKKAIRDKKISVVRSIAKSKTQADIADLLEKLPLKDTLQFFNILKEEQRSEIFNALEDDYKLKLIKIFSDSELKSIVGELFADEIADIVDTVQADFSKRILDNTDKQKVKKVNKILGYSDDKVGSFMSVEIVSIKQTLTVEKTIALIKNKKEEAELTHYFFVVDNQNKLVGYILTEDLLFSTPKKVIKTIMKPTTSVTTTTDKEVAALKFANYDMSVLPVVNSNDIFVG
ncbi:MAG: magnesium transporter, partial [Mycoplasmataceae bacterium]|nr:magnesium transporter [Mycoplasmataceae bacterium]